MAAGMPLSKMAGVWGQLAYISESASRELGLEVEPGRSMGAIVPAP